MKSKQYWHVQHIIKIKFGQHVITIEGEQYNNNITDWQPKITEHDIIANSIVSTEF